MSCYSHSLVGVIEVESRPPANDAPTLQSWFDDAAAQSDRDAQCIRTLYGPGTRSERAGFGVMRADIDQLLADLEVEFERLVGR